MPSYCGVLQSIYIVALFLCFRQTAVITVNGDDLKIVVKADGSVERDEHENVVFVTAGKYW